MSGNDIGHRDWRMRLREQERMYIYAAVYHGDKYFVRLRTKRYRRVASTSGTC